MARKIKRSRDKLQIYSSKMINMLKHVHLGGVINECLMIVKSGKAYIEAVDITNSLIVISKSKIMSEGVSNDFGLGNIELLFKFLLTLEDDKPNFNFNENTLSIHRSDNRRKLDYLLTESELIATRLQFDEKKKKENTYDKMMSLTDYSVDISSTVIKDFMSYIGMLKQKDVVISFDGDDKLSFILGNTDDHNFELVFESSVEAKGDDKPKEFKNKVNGDHLSKIFSSISFNDDNPPKLHFALNKPTVIENDNTTWALIPLTDDEETAENEEAPDTEDDEDDDE